MAANNEAIKPCAPHELPKLLFRDEHSGFVNLWIKTKTAGGLTKWFNLEEPDALDKMIGTVDQYIKQDVYVSTSICREIPKTGEDGSPKPESRVRAQKCVLSRVVALILDCDTLLDPDKAAKGKKVPRDPDTALRGLLATKCPPSFAICSGYGLHVYWMLTDPVDIANEDKADEYRLSIMEPFAKGICTEAAKVVGEDWSGIDFHVSEPCRVLRVDGTYNWKRDKQEPVRMVYPSERDLEEGTRYYSDDELMPYILAGRVTTKDTRTKTVAAQPSLASSAGTAPAPSTAKQDPTAGRTDDDYLQDGLRNDDKLRDLYNGRVAGSSETDEALLTKLYYWTNGNIALMKRTFESSPYWLNGRAAAKCKSKGKSEWRGMRWFDNYLNTSIKNIDYRDTAREHDRKFLEEQAKREIQQAKDMIEATEEIPADLPEGMRDLYNQIVVANLEPAIDEQVAAIKQGYVFIYRDGGGLCCMKHHAEKKFSKDFCITDDEPVTKWIAWNSTEQKTVYNLTELIKGIINTQALTRRGDTFFSGSMQIPRSYLRKYIRNAMAVYIRKPNNKDVNDLVQRLEDTVPEQERPPLLPVMLEDVEEHPLEFVYRPYFQKGTITVLAGDPGVGKGVMLCGILAAMTAPNGLCGITAESSGALILSTEDDEQTWKKRIKYSGDGTVKNIAILGRNNPAAFDTSIDDPRLEELLDKLHPSIVVFDPLQNYLPKDAAGRDLDMNSMSAIGPALQKLTGLLNRHGAAGVIFCHTSKKDVNSFMDKVSGSKGIIGAARSAIMCVPDPQGDERVDRIAIHFKHNSTVAGAAIKYRIEGAPNDPDSARCKFTGLDLACDEHEYFRRKRAKAQLGESSGIINTEPFVTFINKLLAYNPNKSKFDIKFDDVISGVASCHGGDTPYTDPKDIHQCAIACIDRMKEEYGIQLTCTNTSLRTTRCVFDGVPFPEDNSKNGKGITVYRISKPGQQAISTK